MLSMANSGPDTNLSQWFITYGAHPHLDGSYTVFGHLIHGLDTLEKIERTKTDASDRPVRTIVIRNTKIHANPFALWEKEAYLWKNLVLQVFTWLAKEKQKRN